MNSILIVLTVISLHLCKHCSCFNYCSIQCDTGKHTMCKYPEGGGSSCSNFEGGLLESARNHILDIHNKLRQKVATGGMDGYQPASNMMQLEWDNELAEMAQRWSEQCTQYLSHDDCRDSITGEKVGQNIGMIKEKNITESRDKAETIVNFWADEFKDLAVPNRETFDPDRFMSAGHYTQMAWATTTRIGCGYTGDRYETLVFVLVCNYKFAGNVMTKPMYKIGKACSECPPNSACSTTYPGLCYSHGDITIAGIADYIDPTIARRVSRNRCAASLRILKDLYPFIMHFIINIILSY